MRMPLPAQLSAGLHDEEPTVFSYSLLHLRDFLAQHQAQLQEAAAAAVEEQQAWVEARKKNDFPSFAPSKTLTEITADFVAKQKQGRKGNGENEYLQDFLTVAQMICANYGSFSFNDFLTLTRNLDTPASALVPIFHDFIKELQASGRLKTVNGCYDFPQYTFN